MNPIWVDEEGALTGHGPIVTVDPGTGSFRYERALKTLRDSGADRAFASFTFDPDEGGSVVVIPERTLLEPPMDVTATMPEVTILDRGVDVWRTGFEKAMLEIETGRVDKVVLARRVILDLASLPDIPSVVGSLQRRNPGCYCFAIEGLIGASPELLVSLRDGRISTLALAGTATDPAELETEKITEEHRHVSDSVTAVLARHMTEVEVNSKTIVAHGAMSHLGTRLEGQARPGTMITEILADLHPTAAVAGIPKTPALDLIREIEPGTRGRYAGPAGWFDRDGNGVFTIALRCGQLDGLQMSLYAGGGLVAGSEETAELEETELKLVPMFDALGYSA